ncbi:MAG: DUF1488 domain-containing protein [Rhodospirillaceae bacterium]|nr:DUF1488 domain-containing protein [Rhodospirillaceae bacterium]
MPLFMPGKSEAWDASRNAVAFPAEDAAAGTSIVCAISGDALTAHFGAIAGNVESVLDAFRRYRPAIERAASDKYDAAGRPAKLVLVATDFSGTKSAPS